MMPVSQDAVPIYRDNDFYVPSFQLKVGHRQQDQSVIRDITQVVYKDNIESIDGFELTVNNWDAETGTFKYSDEKLFDPGQRIELSMGYLNKNHLRTMLRGEITNMRPTFPASGAPTLAVGGLNSLHKFRGKQVTDTYEKMTDAEIAAKICSRIGVRLLPRASFLPEARNEYTLQYKQYDIVFLLGRARRLGYELVMREDAQGSGLYFGPSGDLAKLTYRLTYGKSLIQFQPSLATANQVMKVTVRGWDAKNGKEISATVNRSQLKTDGLSADQFENVKGAFGDREEIISDRPVRNEPEARELALATLQRISGDMVTGSGSVLGLPDLRAGCVVFIDGLGAKHLRPGEGRFDGRYFVTSTTHTINGSGYTTQFECRREEKR